MSMNEVNEFITAHFNRKLVIVGACTGTDAHTVGIDAIMNMKGYDHHFGLERYPMIEAYNMGSQVPNEKLLNYAREVKADAVLVSQIVTQKDVHLKNLTELIELAEAEGLRDKLLLVVGGPRVDNKLAKELGYDAGFGTGTFAEHVATFVVKKLYERLTSGK
jgi:beta-lysine 5,6-aminomutase beta subunit